MTETDKIAEVAHAWIAAAEARDGKALHALLGENVAVYPPFQHKPIAGRRNVLATFAAFASVTENFTYTRVWSSTSGAIIEFAANIEGTSIHGVDILTLGISGLIVRFDILARPAGSAQALGAAIHHHLDAAQR